jgi:Flp pilus assembly protein TadD
LAFPFAVYLARRVKKGESERVRVMKIQFRSILFALVLPVAACGGNEDTNMVSMAPQDFLPKPVVIDASQPVETPVVIKPVEPALQEPVATAEIEIKAKPGTAQYHIEMARMYISQDKRALAIASAKKAIKLAPNSSQAWNTLGRAELNAKNYENAITAFTTAVEMNSDNAFAWNNLGYTELLLKRYEDAVEHLTEATTKKDATGYMFNNLGTALEHLDNLDDARLAYEAGGKLGSKEAASSRTRLEGVKTIVVVKDEELVGEVHDEVKGDGKGYEITNEGDIEEEQPVAEQVKSDDGEESVDDSEEMPVVEEPSDTATH